MNIHYGQVNPPSTYEKDMEQEIESETCKACNEEVEQTYILGITAYGLFPADKVCSECLNSLHDEFKDSIHE